MSTAVMEKRAREIFRSALFHHYIDEIPCGDEVELWLKTHGGWFPDQQQDYGYGCLMPESDGPDVMSKNSYKALKEAKGVMSILAEFLEDADLKASARSWLEDWNVQDIGFRLEFRETLRGIQLNDGQVPASSSGLTEANVEAHDFRIKFAHERLQSFKDRRDRSRSPRRLDDWDAKAAALQLDIKEASIQNLREIIQSFKATVQSKDARIADLEVQLRIKERSLEMMHEIVTDHCRRAVSRASR